MSDVCSSDLATVLNRSVPSYPPDAYRAREEGTVVVKAQIDALGNASDVEIVSRSGSRILDRAAMNKVRQWKFSPAITDARTVTSEDWKRLEAARKWSVRVEPVVGRIN